MDLLTNVKFMVTTSYGIFGMSIYTGVTVVVLTNKEVRKSSFFQLFCVGYFMNLITYINSFITLRLPQNTGYNGYLYNFFITHSETNRETLFPLNIFHTLHFEFAYTQYIFNCLICANRFTAIFVPIRSEQLWLKYKWLIVLLMFVLPLFFVNGITRGHSFYKFNPATNGFSTDTTYGRSNIYFFLMPTLIILTLVNISFNAYCSVKMYIMKRKGVRVPETSLFFMAFCVFIIDLFLTVLSVLNYYLASSTATDSDFILFLIKWIPLLTPFASDALTLTHPILLLIFSRTVRRKCIENNTYLKRFASHPIFALSNSGVVVVSQQRSLNNVNNFASKLF